MLLVLFARLFIGGFLFSCHSSLLLFHLPFQVSDRTLTHFLHVLQTQSILPMTVLIHRVIRVIVSGMAIVSILDSAFIYRPLSITQPNEKQWRYMYIYIYIHITNNPHPL